MTALLIALDGRPDTTDLGDLAVQAVRQAPRDDPAALAELAEVAGWILFEEERLPEAHAHNALAFTLTQHGKFQFIENLISLNQIFLLTRLGRYGEALALAARGLEGERSRKVRGMFALRQARVYSRVGLAKQAREALVRAQDVLEDDPAAPEWAWWIDEAELNGHRAAVLANLGHLEEAALLFPPDDGLRFREVLSAMRFRTLHALGEWRGDRPEFRSPRARHTATGVPGGRCTRCGVPIA
ncbi:hypothetical protein [Saccharothrix variisporea]|nr:hypothetical protein [Saccharothrix variisporea]